MRVLLYICIVFWLVGCTKTIYVPIESVRVEYQDRYLRDSIYRYDSVYFAVKGDTVWLEKYQILYKDRFFRDSIFIQDTIRVPYPVDKIVEVNRLRWYQKTLIWTGVGALVLLMIWLIKRRR